MLKKVTIILIKIFLLLLIVLGAISTELAFSIFTDYPVNILRFLIYLMFAFFIYLILKVYIPTKWSSKEKVISIIGIGAILICSLEIWTYQSDKRLKHKQFHYPLANCSQMFRGVLSNSFGDYLVQKILGQFNYTNRYLLISAFDACRVIRIKELLKDDYERKNICIENEKPSGCLKEILLDNMKYRVFTETGLILVLAVGAMNIFEEKKSREPVKHPLLTPEIERRNKNLNILISMTDLLEITSIVSSYNVNENHLKKILPDFPIDEVNSIPLNKKKDLDQLIKNDLAKDEMSPFYFFDDHSKYNQSEPRLSSDVLEAYILKSINDSITFKLQKTTCDSMNVNFNKVLDKINDKDFIKDITQKEFVKAKIKLDEYKERMSMCNSFSFEKNN